MKTYVCRWPNGDVSLVSAVCTDEALYTLNEAGDPRDVVVTEVVKSIAVHFQLEARTGLLGIGESIGLDPSNPFSEHMNEVLCDAYPILDAVFMANDFPNPDHVLRAIDEEKQSQLLMGAAA